MKLLKFYQKDPDEKLRKSLRIFGDKAEWIFFEIKF